MSLVAKDPQELLAEFEPRVISTVEHDRQIWQARFSPCGEYLFAAGYDAAISRWKLLAPETAMEPSSLEALEPLTGHHGWTQCLDFARKTGRLLTADSWGKLVCRDYKQDSCPVTWSHDEAHDGWIRGLHCSPDGEFVATVGNDHALRIWRISDGKMVGEVEHSARVFSVQFHPDGQSVCTGDLEGQVRRWSFAGRGAHMVELLSYDASILYQLHRIQHCGGARCLKFDEAGEHLLVAGQKTPQGGFATGTPCALVFEAKSGRLVREMPIGGTNDGFMYDVRFHPEGFVMGASSAFPGKGHLWFWFPEAEKPFFQSNKLSNGRSLEAHPNGQLWAMVISDSANGNGRPEGEYPGGSAKVHLLQLGAESAHT